MKLVARMQAMPSLVQLPVVLGPKQDLARPPVNAYRDRKDR